MGYNASGDGSVVLKKEVPEEILELLNSSDVGFETEDSPDGGLWLTFYYDKYHEDDVIHALNKLAPYTESGDIEFTGEDDTHWQFHFENGKVEERDGEVVYKSGKKTRSFRIVFMQKNNDPNIKEDYYFDGVTISTDGQTTEEICVDLMNGWRKYIEENNIDDVVDGVNEIYEEE